MSSPLNHLSYRRLRVLICLQAPVSLSSCFGNSFSTAPLRIASVTLSLIVDWQSWQVTFPASQHDFFHVKTARFALFAYLRIWNSLICQNVGFLIRRFSSMCFYFDQEGCVSAAVLFRSILITAARISASCAPTRIAFPPSTIHLLTAFNNDWMAHKYSNGSFSGVSLMLLGAPQYKTSFHRIFMRLSIKLHIWHLRLRQWLFTNHSS